MPDDEPITGEILGPLPRHYDKAGSDRPMLRDEKGHWMKGTKPGPGGFWNRRLAAWRRTLADCLTVEDMQEVIEILITKAKSGQRWAIKELLDRSLGKPVTPVELSSDADDTAPRKIILVDMRVAETTPPDVVN